MREVPLITFRVSRIVNRLNVKDPKSQKGTRSVARPFLDHPNANQTMVQTLSKRVDCYSQIETSKMAADL